MNNKHILESSDISPEQISDYIKNSPEPDEITCLISQNDEHMESVLKENGFRYAGKRRAGDEVLLVYTWFRNAVVYEDMSSFFDRRADDYNLHMSDGNDFYEAGFISLVKDIPETEERILVLDLGCGTGVELGYIFGRASNAYITCIDVSEKMLDILREEYAGYKDNLDIICGSYIGADFGKDKYHYAVACSTLHHLPPVDKLALYKNIIDSLKPGGYFLILDYVALDAGEELSQREEYLGLIEDGVIDKNGIYHIDLPLTLEHEEDLLKTAGFVVTGIERMGENGVVISVKKDNP